MTRDKEEIFNWMRVQGCKIEPFGRDHVQLSYRNPDNPNEDLPCIIVSIAAVMVIGERMMNAQVEQAISCLRSLGLIIKPIGDNQWEMTEITSEDSTQSQPPLVVNGVRLIELAQQLSDDYLGEEGQEV